MALRVSKRDAAQRLGVAPITIDRRIERGELATEREPWGTKERVWVLLDEETPVDSAEATDEPTELTPAAAPVDSEMVQVRVLQERVNAQEQLIEMYKTQLTDAEWRYHQLAEQLATAQRTAETLSRALPAGAGVAADTGAGRSRWAFWRRG